MAYDKKGCLLRLGKVLVGQVEPSVQAVHEAAKDIKDFATSLGIKDFTTEALRNHYQTVVREPVPQKFTDLVNNIGGNRRAPH